jgi:hypothetical protein
MIEVSGRKLKDIYKDLKDVLGSAPCPSYHREMRGGAWGVRNGRVGDGEDAWPRHW